MGVRPHGDSFGGKLNGLQSRAGQQRSHPYGKAVLAARASSYGKAVLAARASSPPTVQGSRVVVILNQCTPHFKHASSGSWRRDLQHRPDFDEHSREMNCSQKNELFARKSN